MYHLVYTSTATVPFTPAELRQALLQWRAANSQRALTGVLLYSPEGHIMQVLEGAQQQVESMFARIERNLRHRNVIKLAAGPIAERLFCEWSMGFRTLEPARFRHLAGYANLSQRPFLNPRPAAPDEGLLELLREFATPEAAALPDC